MKIRLRRLARSFRFWASIAALAWVSAALGWTLYGYGLWVFVLMSVVTLGSMVAAEETRVRESRGEAKSAHKRECHHGASSWGPFDANGDERERRTW